MQKPSKPFQIISVCLLFGILGASALWLAFPPRPSISEEKANGMRYKNAEEYRHVSEWMKTLHGWNLSDSDLAEAKKLLAQGSPAARSMAFIVLSTRVSHKPYDEKITSLLADCARPGQIYANGRCELAAPQRGAAGKSGLENFVERS